LVAWIRGARPFEHWCELIGVESMIVEESTDDHVEHRLGHRPRQELAVRTDGFGGAIKVELLAGVALDEHLAALNNDHGVRGGELFVTEHLINDAFEFVLVVRRPSGPRNRWPRHADWLRRDTWLHFR
jgi:hypothetical protein